VNGGPCGARNFYYARPTGITVKEAWYECKLPKKVLPAASEGKTSVNNQPTLDAAALEKMIEEKIASGLQQALDARHASDGSVLAGFAQDDYLIEKMIEEKITSGFQQALDAQQASDRSALAGFAQAAYSDNKYSLGLGGIDTDSGSLMDGNETRIPDEDDAIIDKFGNNVEACLGWSKNHSNMLKLVNQLASMSWLFAILYGIHEVVSKCTNRVGQVCHVAISWVAPAAGARHTTTACVCMLLVCCVLFAQFVSTQALTLQAIKDIGARHAVENWGIEISLGAATRLIDLEIMRSGDAETLTASWRDGKQQEVGSYRIYYDIKGRPDKIIDCCMSFKIKKDRDGNILEYRARCNADGRQQEVGSYSDTFAPTFEIQLYPINMRHCSNDADLSDSKEPARSENLQDRRRVSAGRHLHQGTASSGFPASSSH